MQRESAKAEAADGADRSEHEREASERGEAGHREDAAENAAREADGLRNLRKR